MKKLAVVLALALVLVCCGLVWRVTTGRTAAPPIPADEDEQSWIDTRTGVAGVFVKKFDDHRLVLVCAGEKPTGGYAVEIHNVTGSDQAWLVDVQFVAPGPGDLVTQALTYPYAFTRVKDDGRAVRVRDVSGGEPVELPVTTE